MCHACGCTFITITKMKAHKCPRSLLDNPDEQKQVKSRAINKELFFSKFCRYCNIHFETWEEKSSHACPFLINSSDPKKYYLCRICGKEVGRKSFSGHSSVHSERKYECTICSKKFKRRDALTKHVKTHEKKYRCNCDKVFSKHDSLLMHLAKKHGIPFPEIQCDICDRSYPSTSRLKDHKKRVHDNPGQNSTGPIKEPCAMKNDFGPIVQRSCDVLNYSIEHLQSNKN